MAARHPPLIVATAADDAYAHGLSVAMASLAAQADPGRQLIIHVLDGGLKIGRAHV